MSASTTNALPNYDDALCAVLSDVSSLPVETVVLENCEGRVLRESIVADRDLPPFNRAQMDGYALRASELGSRALWPVAATINAGDSFDVAIPSGTCVRIATGAGLPADVDTVIQHELSDRHDPVSFTIDSIEPGHAVHHRGSDAIEGRTLLESGIKIGPQHIAIAAAVGRHELSVTRQPSVSILTSGDEVVDVSNDVKPWQIRNSNGPMLRALFQSIGATIVATQHVPDDERSTTQAVANAIETSDLIVTVGGVSAGHRDYFPAAFETHGIKSVLTGASIQPGKPIRVGRTRHNSCVVALPGNPVSALVCAHLFIQPLLLALTGTAHTLPWRTSMLAEDVKPNPRRQAFRPCIIDPCNRATVPAWAGSGDIVHTAATTGLVRLPIQDERVVAGTELSYLPWAWSQR